MTSPCVAALPAQLAGISMAQTGMLPTGLQGGRPVVDCPRAGVVRPDAALRRQIDDKLVCMVMCCCDQQPNTGGTQDSPMDLKQSCASGALQAADALLGWRSRYKPEVSFDMTASPPRPFMHRDATGADTTRRSEYWLGRAKSEIENYTRGRGMVRRPDMTIVRDPCLPPTADNIERIVEMKFGGDSRDPYQDAAYESISRSEENYQVFRVGGPLQKGEQGCDCSEGQRQPQPVPVPVPASATERQTNWGQVGSLVGYGALAAVGVVATVALAAVAFDGPAGEAAAGAGTLAAAARAAQAWRALFPAVAAAGAR